MFPTDDRSEQLYRGTFNTFQFIGGRAGGPKRWDNEKRIFISKKTNQTYWRPEILSEVNVLSSGKRCHAVLSISTNVAKLPPSPVQKSCFNLDDEVGSLKTLVTT